MKRLALLSCLAALMLPLQMAPAHAQAPVDCPAPGELAPSELYGLWQLTLWPLQGGSEAAPASSGALLFERHPEYPGSVRGQLKRSTRGNDRQAQVSGDVTNGGEFNLDESADGVKMDAVWEGHVVVSGCAHELRGIRRIAEGSRSDEAAMNFLLKKAPGGR